MRNFATHRAYLNNAVRDTDRIWIFLDQAIVSGGNFLVLILLARNTNAENVGYYALAISFVMILQGLQDSIITRPYLVHHADPGVIAKEFAGGALLLCFLFALSSATIFLAFSLFDFSGQNFQKMESIFSILALTIPAYLMREFSRRFLMSKLMAKKVFIWDSLGLSVLIIMLIGMSKSNVLDAYGALLAISISYGSIFIIWLYFEWHYFSINLSAISKTFLSFWEMGKWLVGDRMSSDLRGYLNHWLALIFLGPAAIGAYAACMNIVALSNPFVLGMLNYMAPKSVRVIQANGIKGLKQQVFVDFGIMTAALFSFALLLTVFGKEILDLVFSNNDFSTYANVLTIMAFASAVASSSAPIVSGLITAKKSKQASAISISMLFCQLFVAPLCIYLWGLEGAAYTILVVEIIGLIAWSKLFWDL